MKELFGALDDMQGAAIRVAIKAGAVVRCACHPDIVLVSRIDDDALTEACKIANAQISRGEINLPACMERRDFTDLIKKVIEMSAWDCPRCSDDK
jgi:hypothetical protein